MGRMDMGPESASPFDVRGELEIVDGREVGVSVIQVDPFKIGGFETSFASKEIVAAILGHTINTAHQECAVGIRDAERTFHIVASMGSKLLDDLAPRTDDSSWHDWIQAEFPNALAQIYGEESSAVKFGRSVAKHSLATAR